MKERGEREGGGERGRGEREGEGERGGREREGERGEERGISLHLVIMI